MTADRSPSSISEADDNMLTSKVNNQCFYISPPQPSFLIIALLFLGSNHLGTKHSDAVRSQREVWSYWDANWENLSEESKKKSWGATEQGTLQMELPAMNVCQLWWAHRSPTEVNLDLLQQYSKYYVIPDKQYSIVTSSSHFIPVSETIFNILDIFKHMIQLDCLIAVTLQTWRFPWNMNYAPHYAQNSVTFGAFAMLVFDCHLCWCTKNN